MGLLPNQAVQKSVIATVPDRAGGIARLENISVFINRGLAWIAAASLLLMVFVVVVNGVMRVVHAPYPGASEIVGWLAAVTTAFALGYTQHKRGYVEIDALVERLPFYLQKIIKQFMLLTGTAFFALVAWQSVVYGLKVANNGNLSETMHIPFYPLIFLMSLGFVGLTLALFVDFLKEFNGSGEE